MPVVDLSSEPVVYASVTVDHRGNRVDQAVLRMVSPQVLQASDYPLLSAELLMRSVRAGGTLPLHLLQSLPKNTEVLFSDTQQVYVMTEDEHHAVPTSFVPAVLLSATVPACQACRDHIWHEIVPMLAAEYLDWRVKWPKSTSQKAPAPVRSSFSAGQKQSSAASAGQK